MYSNGERTRHFLKNGSATGTTVGTLSPFMSFVRKYFTVGELESLELAILPHENETAGTFPKGGDSGALIVSGMGEFVGLMTSGTSKGTDGSDITFTTPFRSIWISYSRSSLVLICTGTTLRPSWPQQQSRFASFFDLYPAISATWAPSRARGTSTERYQAWWR